MPDIVRVPVWRRCIFVGIVVIIVIWCCWWFWWRCPLPCPPASDTTCDCLHHAEIFFVAGTTTSCTAVDYTGSTPTSIMVDRGDAVVWTNETSSAITLDFRDDPPGSHPNGSPFGREVITIPANGQWVSVIRVDAATGTDYDYDVDCTGGGGGVGGPKVNVGGG